MNISFSLNGKNVAIDVEPEKRLVDVLREDFHLIGTKAGCYAGRCGTCHVLIGGRLGCSCMLPAFTARGAEVVTVEGFARTREYGEIVDAFEQAEYYPCEYCSAGRILAVEALLAEHPDPSESEILTGLSGITCHCADQSSLSKAVEIAAFSRKLRRRGKRT